MRKAIAQLFTVLLLMTMACCAAAESWICPACGQEENIGNFCPNCGTARPDEPYYNENTTQIPGEENRVSVNILRIDASGYIKGKKDEYLYAPWNVTDEDHTTCWQFSTKNMKKDPPWLCMVVEGETVDGIWIRNGFQGQDQKGNDRYPQYSRLKDITVVFVYTDDNPLEQGSMTFTLTDENSGEWERLDTGRHQGVDLVWLYVDSVYKGKNSNACLTEIMLVQNAPAESAMPPWR